MVTFSSFSRKNLKIFILIFITLITLIFIFSRPAITQNPLYHQFIDTRGIGIVPNARDVLSNILFLIVGIFGYLEVSKVKSARSRPWKVFFMSIFLIAPGSAFYHWNPNNLTLIWDRIPMSVGFMALYIVMISEHISIKTERFLPLAIIMGVVSVLIWVWTEDLRFYFWIQYSSFIAIPIILLSFRSRFTHKGYFSITLLMYGLAKLAEAKDQEVFELTRHWFSGHTLKHVLAALGIFALSVMLRVRKLRV